MKIDEKRIPQDGRFTFKLGEDEVDLRVSTLPTVNGEKVVMRLLKKTGGAVEPVADGVGDDYKATLYLQLLKVQHQAIPLEQVCIAVDDYAFISFPGELFTEIGMRIKAASPFRHTYILGLANGCVGYIPTRRAIGEGSYEPEMRKTDDSAEDIIAAQSLALLRRVHG